MEKYQRAYAYLFGQMDEALSLMEHGNLLNFGRVKSILVLKIGRASCRERV